MLRNVTDVCRGMQGAETPGLLARARTERDEGPEALSECGRRGQRLDLSLATSLRERERETVRLRVHTSCMHIYVYIYIYISTYT